MKAIISIRNTFLLVLGLSFKCLSQIDCLPGSTTFSFIPTASGQTKSINWTAFPEFSLPFKIIYGGPRFNDNQQLPLKHGFSHISTYFGADSVNLPVKNRALIWYGVAYNFQNPQPWQEIRSPWANNLELYKTKWRGDMAAYASHFTDTKGTSSPAADILMMDIERHWEGQFQIATDMSILAQKNSLLIPKSYSLLPDIQYVNRYKNDMLKLYAEPINYLKNAGLLTKFNKISSYADVPIRNQTFNIEGNQWADWQVNTERLSYLMKDSLSGKLGGNFYSQMDILAPTCYVHDDYAANPKAKGGNYLAEFLFQIEVNKVWSPKEILPFVWLRYEDFSLPGARFVKPYQAEAMAVFPFMAGSKGLWLWEDGNTFSNNDNYAIYEYFINGLYKLSLYKSFFEGENVFYMPTNARDLYVSQTPVWRAVIKGKQILIAAQNPYAAENENTNFTVNYKNWSNKITLKGRELFLCAFEMADITSIEPTKKELFFTGFENPLIENTINFKFDMPTNQIVEISLNNMAGKNIFAEKVNAKIGQNSYSKYLPELPPGEYLLSLITNEGVFAKKILN
jgi:hypothetical protein